MEPEAVKERLALLNDRLAEAEADVEKAHADIRALQRQCRHPNARRTSHMGENCHHCYDCGACDV